MTWLTRPMLLIGVLVLASAARADPDVRITRGTITVPESRDGRPGRPIALAYLRLHGTAPATATPIVYLAGGPGGSGIADMAAPRFAPYRRWLAFADIVALDQRGTGASMPSLACCPTSPASCATSFAAPTPRRSWSAPTGSPASIGACCWAA